MVFVLEKLRKTNKKKMWGVLLSQLKFELNISQTQAASITTKPTRLIILPYHLNKYQCQTRLGK